MPGTPLSVVEQVIRASWSAASCDPVDEPWSPENPAKGQCGVTALVLQDHLGGELVMAEVLNADGSRQGVHYWNRLPDGVDVDLTREQFVGGEVVQEPGTVVERPDDVTRGRVYGQYVALATRVREGLARLGAVV
jgi:hypothetical protein